MGAIHDLLVGCLVLAGVALGAAIVWWFARHPSAPQPVQPAQVRQPAKPPFKAGPADFSFEVHKEPPPKAPFAIGDEQRAEMQEWDEAAQQNSRWVDKPVSESDPW